MTIVTIDFEASCLPRHGRSFPIEVGVAGDGMARSWLIRPHPTWITWDWTAEAESLHGISRARIETEGQGVDVVLAQLAACVADVRVVADSMIDQYWLDTLAAAAGAVAPFTIDHVSQLLDEHRADEAQIAAAVDWANRLCPARHRAASDAQWLATLIAHVSGQGWNGGVGSWSRPAPILSAN